LELTSIKELLPATQMIDLQRLESATWMLNMDQLSHQDLLSTFDTQQNRNLIPMQQPRSVSISQFQ
jgi:hypothetical protein